MSKTQHPKARQSIERGRNIFDSAWGVYVLKCERVDPTFLRETSLSRIDREPPEWARTAAQYQNIYYVGSTQDILKRLGEHDNYGAADFTRLFRVESVMEVKLCQRKSEARQLEAELPTYYRAWERRYCYSDLRQHENVPGSEMPLTELRETVKLYERYGDDDLADVEDVKRSLAKKRDEDAERLVAELRQEGHIVEPERGRVRWVG